MSPQSFCCWLADRRWPWIFLSRWRPTPDRKFPWAAVLAAPLAGAAVAAAIPGVLAVAISILAPNVARAVSFKPVIGMAAEFGAIAGLWLGLFTLASWNQRAARIQAGTLAGPVSPGWISLLVMGPLYAFGLGLAAPWCLLVGVENIRGAAHWNRVRSELIARGEKMRIEELAPVAGPDDGNFGSLPMFAELFAYGPKRGDSNRWKDPRALQRFRLLQLPDAHLPKRPKGENPTEPSLADWADAFQTATRMRLDGKDPNGNLPAYGKIPEGANAARTVLSALSVADADLEQLKAASKRPQSVFGVRWNEGFEALLPHLQWLKAANKALELRCQARLASGDSIGAWDDTLAAVRIADALRDEPLIISQLVRFAQMSVTARMAKRGIELHAWTEPQLAELEQGLATWRPLSGMVSAVRGERAAANLTLDRWSSSRRAFADEMNNLGAVNSGDQNPSTEWSAYVMPTGWIRDAQATLALYEQSIVDALRPAVDALPPGGLAVVQKQIDESAAANGPLGMRARPGGQIVAMMVPGFGNAVTKAFHAEHVARCSVVACALERNRIAHGSYPATLDALVPAFLPVPPIDVMDGKPLRYERTPDGRFRLWSVGPNGKDDGGRASDPRTGKPLDWVWP